MIVSRKHCNSHSNLARFEVNIMKNIHKTARLCGFILLIFLNKSNAEFIRIPMYEIDLLEAIEKISNEYEVYFTFDMTLVADVKVDYKHNSSLSAQEAIASILRGTGLKYKFYDERFVILYREDAQGLESLKKMSQHLEGLINEREKIVDIPVRSDRTVSPLERRTVFREINPIQYSVEGIVMDENGEPLIGVNILVEGTGKGTVTDFDGRFELKEIDVNSTLIISYIGYQSKEIRLNGQANITIVLESIATQIQDIVITAFGSQTKQTLTGSISSVSGEDIAVSPVANVTNALVGQVPGVIGLQNTGEPGRNETNIKIRGIGTYGNSNPLVVIDGVEQAAEQGFTELNAMDPNEIANISILKDASATAVYGIRAANGVIIVSTKRGQTGEARINLTVDYGVTNATMMMRGLDSYRWAKMRNEAIGIAMNSFDGQGGTTANLFSEDDLWKLQNNRDYTPEEVDAMSQLSEEEKNQLKSSPALYYGSQDPYAQLFGNNGPQRQVNLNVSGGSERVKYFTSFGYFNQESFAREIDYHGVNIGSGYRRFNFRSNFDIDVVENLTISLNIAGQFGKMRGPGTSFDPYDISGRNKAMMQLVNAGNPIQSFGIRDGHFIAGLNGAPGTHGNPLGAIIGDSKGGHGNYYYLFSEGSGYLYNNLLDNSIKVNYKMPYILEGLSLRGTVNYQDNYNKYVTLDRSYPSYLAQRDPENPNEIQYFGGGYSSDWFSSTGYSTWNKFYVDGGINYDGSLNRHNFSALALAKASMYTMPNDNFNTSSGIMGFLGRVDYNYANRYLVEFNMGYNGTEQFAEGRRFGFFPAFSAGWIPTFEPFFPRSNALSFLKFKGSYGIVGNDLLGNTGRRYLYLPNAYSLSSNGYYLGRSDGSSANSYYQGASESYLGNPGVTWEKAVKRDIGFEAIFFREKLTVEFDWFSESRDNILTTLGIIPLNYGVVSGSVPPANVGKTENKGYEVLLRWEEDKGRNFGYSIQGHLTHAKNKIIYQSEPPNPYDWMNATGKSIGQKFGLLSDGLFNTAEEVNNRPFNNFTGNRATVGDIRFKDINGDGIIDDKDIVPIGYPSFPEFTFGAKLQVRYKGFVVDALVNGTRNGSYYMNHELTRPFQLNGGNAYEWMWDGRWTPEKVANGEQITYPRAQYAATSEDNNFLVSDYWLKSTDFLRLKNVQVSYTFNLENSFIGQLGVTGLRTYISGYNLYTFKNEMTELGLDPEITDGHGGFIYPMIKTFNFGINLNF